ncbi:hypothetical protein LIER_35915 [Lithospermum erythrorhizon]|uniref:Uncharacterized protein n=1 Tax=Lithospermum erythrorhizon TaxID=34254 RepID=A0AAV3NZG8_LITER
MRNMLYHGLPGKASPTRWHKYWFLVKDAFLDERAEEARRGFSRDHRNGRLRDPDVLIKGGLSRGINNFPDIDLGTFSSLLASLSIHLSFNSSCPSYFFFLLATLLRAKDGKAIVPHQVSYLDAISRNRFVDQMLIAATTPSGVGPSTTALSADESTEEQMPLDQRSSPQLPTPTPQEQPSTTPDMVFIPTGSSSLPDALGSSNMPHRVPSWNVIEGSSKAPEGLARRSNIEKGFENNHPFFMDLPYTLP